MKKLTLILAAFALAFGGFTATASAAAPIDGLRIGQIGYNAVGNDWRGNRNAEYVDITARAETDITGLVVHDAWRQANPDHKSACNTFTVGVDHVDDSLKKDDKVVLPARHTLRVYVGSGKAAAFGRGNRVHAVYMNHGVGDTAGCGYRGHFLNNSHDTVWIKLNGAEESKSYDFRRGYHVN